MTIAVTVTQDSHDPPARLQLYSSGHGAPVHLGTTTLWRNSTCTDAEIHHLHWCHKLT